MTAFHFQQPDCGRRVRKNANASTFQIHVTNCTTKLRAQVHEVRKIQCNNFSSWCNHKVQFYRFNEVQALPLNFVRFLRLANRSPMIQRNPTRRSRNDREPSGKKSGEMSRSLPHYFPAMAGQLQMRCRRISARVTRETTRNMARNVRTAVRAIDNATTHEPSRKTTRQNFFVTS
jgi:hypothetical protein